MSGGGEEQEMAAKINPGEQDGAAPVEGEQSVSEGGEAGTGEPVAEDAAVSSSPKSKNEPSGFGETVQLKTFHLNLGNPLENHYIRVDVALEYRGGEQQAAEIDKRLPQLRDAIVGVISRQTRDMILDPDGKAQLRREMLIRVNRYMKQPIEAVYITDILIE
jgi:flagellar FliL protein